MKKSTSLQALLSGIVSLGFLCLSTPTFAQHGGGHSGGGGGSHASAGGGFHGGGGSFGGPHGGFSGGYHGGAPGFSGRGTPTGPGVTSRAPGGASAGHPWSWEGRSSRDTSPGWHQFPSSNSRTVGREGAGSAATRSSASSMAARSAAMPNHSAVADGQWHSFAAPRTEIARTTQTTSFNHAGLVSSNLAWHGNWVNGSGWHGGWHTWGWGYPGWNWGWGFGWGCCGWGWGFGWGWGWGFGWGWGWGFGVSWTPFWAWPPYGYDPWLYANVSAPYVLDPYPG